MQSKIINLNTYKASKDLETAYKAIHKERIKVGLKQGYTVTIKAN